MTQGCHATQGVHPQIRKVTTQIRLIHFIYWRVLVNQRAVYLIKKIKIALLKRKGGGCDICLSHALK